jgi:hypothetical protein
MNADDPLHAPAAPPDAAWETVRDLIAILARPPKATRLLNELERRMADVKQAEAKLTADREAFEQASSKTRAEHEEKAARLRSKEISLMGRESMAERIIQRDAAAFHDRNRPLAEGFTISREPA